MTPGTSPRPWGSFFNCWAKAASAACGTVARLPACFPELRPGLTRAAATLYLGGLCIILTTAWHDPAMGTGGLISGLPAWHLAFLLMTGATAALLTLLGGPTGDRAEKADEPPVASPAGLTELMAQMSHDLRTPLNAVIGFSEVMQRELHGPLGNARYQEYAQHIGESGGRLLKSSEDALAITETMTVLMTDRPRGKRQRLIAGPLVRDAWRVAVAAVRDAGPRLALTGCNTCEIVCERRPAVRALEHLLREAIARLPAGGRIEVAGRRRAGTRALDIRVRGEPSASTASEPLGASLRVILARLLLETQGATLECKLDAAGAWSAVIEFPAKA